MKRTERTAIGRLLWGVTAWLVTNVTVTVLAVFFFVLNRTTVTGRRHAVVGRNVLLVANHQSMIDSFVIGLAAYYPKAWWKPYLLPWNPAAVENFFKNPVLAWLADRWRCIPVRPGRRDLHALHQMIQVLPRGVMIVFPEGTRTRDGAVHRGRPGAGLVILATHPTVIPVAIDGMQKVLPIGSYVPRLFKRVRVSFGEPVDCSDFFDRPRTKETAQEVVDRVMQRVEAQHLELRKGT